ncbi:MAG: rhodanese-like domain-containing protein [Flavobacteriales bacterium]|nr:rhodanese-like domain-containing protein [Flavobacteriales bacterium]
MKEITPESLKNILDTQAVTLLDVREAHEREQANIRGIHIPVSQVIHRINEIPKHEEVVVYCRSGARSASVIQALTSMHGYQNLTNLKGGLLAYAKTVDSSLEVA